MEIVRTLLKTIYLLFAVGVGIGCCYSYIFFIFNIGNGGFSADNKPAAFGVAALALMGTIVFYCLAGSFTILTPILSQVLRSFLVLRF